MPQTGEVIVLGLGGIGSAVAHHLACQGVSVVGIEQFSPVHDLGSSHGETRAIRKAYFEDARYIPLILRSYELWEDFERTTGQYLLEKCGCLIMGPKKSTVVERCQAAAKSAGLPFQMLNQSELSARYGFETPKESLGFYEPDGGFLHLEKSIECFIRNATASGANLQFNQKIKSWKSLAGKVEVVTDQGVHTAEKLILCLGSWTGLFLPLSLPLAPKRTVMFWFDQGKARDNSPVFFQETLQGPWIYGFPSQKSEIKLAFHNFFEDCHPDTIRREISQKEKDHISTYANALLPTLGSIARAKSCIYTMTPDENFILGPLREPNSNVFLAGGFSGHGFKFAPVIGEIAHDFVTGRKQHDIDFLNPYRFG